MAFVILGLLGAVSRPEDATLFRNAGESMLGSGILDVFSNANLQVGPVYLLALGVLARLVEVLHLPVFFVLAGIQGAGVTWLGMITARRLAIPSKANEYAAQWAVGTAMVLTGVMAEALIYGHPEEILVGLVLANAAIASKENHRFIPGLLVGLAASMKLWGVLGIPLLLVGRRWRDLLPRCVAAAVVVAVCYFPFFLFGVANTFTFHWPLGVKPLIGLIVPWLPRPDWTLRVVQGAVAGVLGACAALRRTASPLPAVIVVIAVRLLLDPLQLSYYPGPLIVVLLLWLWTSPATVGGAWRLGLTAAVPAVVLVPHLAPMHVVGVISLGLLVAVPVCVLWWEHVRAPQIGAQPAAATG